MSNDGICIILLVTPFSILAWTGIIYAIRRKMKQKKAEIPEAVHRQAPDHLPGVLRCKNCNAVIGTGICFCEECGQAVEKTCRACGAEFSDDILNT